MQHLCRPALFLVIPFATGDKQDLAAGDVYASCSVYRELECYVEYRAVERAFCRDQHFKPDWPGEMIIELILSPFGKITRSGICFDVAILPPHQ